MNRDRRKEIQKLIGVVGDAMLDIQSIQSEEESYRDEIPENLQGSERYTSADAAVDALAEAADSIESAINSLDEACQ